MINRSLLLQAGLSGAVAAALLAGAAEAGELKTPASIAAEHHEIHETLSRSAGEPGDLGRAAGALARVLEPHFRREEEIATPPLSLLPALAAGPATAEMRAVLPLTQALERELPQMLREHQEIGRARSAFEQAARRAGREEYVELAEALAAHAKHEEDVLYPAAIVVGRYIAQAFD